jgi:limonene-1,2-epoxide hydrolase
MSVVNDFEKAFNRQDVGALVSCFTEGASYRDNFYGEHRGHASLHAMFERMFREGRDYTWVMDTVTEAVPRSTGRKIGFRGMSLFELERGKIAVYREYFDVGQALLQLGFAPEALTKVLRRKLEGH